MLVETCIVNEYGLAPLEAARSFVRKVRKPARILVAISGGSDSTGILLALHEAVAQLSCGQLRLFAVTIDHALRPEAADETQKVSTLCAELSISHVTRRWDDAKPSSGLSEASRLARYRLISEVAREIGADSIVTGHTRGDQRETVVMRAARSNRDASVGLSGMADAMLYDGRFWVLRPFLNCERQAIRDFVSSRGRCWIDDPSNENAEYERIRIRQALPLLPRYVENDAGERRRRLSAKTAEYLHQHASVFHATLAKVACKGLRPDLQELRYALAALVATLGGRVYFPSTTSMDRVIDFLKDGRAGRMTVGRVLVDRRRDGLYLVRERRDLPECLIEPEATDIWDNRFLITNHSALPLRVEPGEIDESRGAASLFQDVPPGVARQAMHVMPRVVTAATDREAPFHAVDIGPRLSPFDLFLPRFDLALADAIAVLFGRSAYPQPPV